MSAFTNPLAGHLYEQAWGPWGGTHRRGQNWQSGSAWDLLHDATPMSVHAPFAGVVVSAGQGGAGRFAGAKVGIQGTEMSCFLTHLSELSVSKGEVVSDGQVIGLTGQANGVWHLHIALGGLNYWDYSDANGIDPRPFLEGSATLVAARGPKGFPLWRGATATKTLEREPVEPPHGNTLRLVLHVPGELRRTLNGWDEASGALRWIAKNGIKPDTKAAIGWRGNVWRGPTDVTNVARSLVRRYLEGEGK